jgi:FtsZ-binding cell division protein ZapB
MTYSNAPSASPAPQSPKNKKDNRAIVYGALILLLLGTWGYIIYDKSKTGEQLAQNQAQLVQADSSKSAIQEQFNEANARLDEMTGKNAKLDSLLKRDDADITAMKSRVKSILGKEHATAAELAEARNLIAKLNGQIDGYIAEIEKLKGENLQLTQDKATVTAQRDAVQKNYDSVSVVKNNLQDVGSTLHASNIAISAFDEKSNGKEKETTSARKANGLKVSFQLDENRIAETGSKDLYICITDPAGQPVSVQALGSGTFTTRDTGDKVFTVKKSVDYVQGQVLPVEVTWKQNGKFTKGQYKIEVYNNGFKIGAGTVTLRKGGIFG